MNYKPKVYLSSPMVDNYAVFRKEGIPHAVYDAPDNSVSVLRLQASSTTCIT